jgi:carboxypeptidase Taq
VSNGGRKLAKNKATPKTYETLISRYRDYYLNESIRSILVWDQLTYIPPGGIPLRGEQLAHLSKWRLQFLKSPKLQKLLDKTEKDTILKQLTSAQKRNVHLIRRKVNEWASIPEELAMALVKQQSIAMGIWKRAKQSQDWALFEPELAKSIELYKQRAEILMEINNTPTPYDALIDLNEPRITQDIISRVFSKTRKQLIPLIDRCVPICKSFDFSFLERSVPIPVQRQISTALADFIEYDTTSPQACGRIDETEHPFSTGYLSDLRITTHYYETNFTAAFYSTLHEGGHVLYDVNLLKASPEYMFQPIGDQCSGGFSECSARFVENVVGRTPEFIQAFYPLLNQLTNGALKDINPDLFTQAINRVQPSKIRIEADELTYLLHIIIRFELEQGIFTEKIKISELPSLWNQKYDEYLGIEIQNDAEGVLQDIHWAWGFVGYFPSYALGNLYGAQLLAVMEKECPDWRSKLAEGKFSSVNQWLSEHFHRYGKLFDPEDLLRHSTGMGLTAEPFINYAETKYSDLFGL